MKNRIKWEDNYKIFLCVTYHLAECKRKQEYYTDIGAKINIENEIDICKISQSFAGKIFTKSPKFANTLKNAAEDAAKKELDKELVDLYLLLEAHIEMNNLDELVNERVNRFAEKAGKAKEQTGPYK